MRSRHTSNHRLATALVAALVMGLAGLSAAFTQDPVDQAENWRDQIGPNDKQVTGIVGLVHDDTFELQSHGTMYFFEKPSDAEQLANVRTGTEVQVFFDPSGYQRDGNSYYRTSVVAINGDPAAAPQSRTSTQADQAEVSTEAQSTVVTDDSQQDATQLAQNENLDRSDESAAPVQGEQDESSDFDGRLDDEQTLPQTAGVLPLVGLMGLLGLLGAVALRVLRS